MTEFKQIPGAKQAASYSHDARGGRLALRLKLLSNGYVPLPNEGKPCYLKGWPKVEVTEADLFNWENRSGGTTTGLRLDRLVAFDADSKPPHTARLLATIEERTGETPLERVGNRARSMLIYRAADDLLAVDWRHGMSSPVYYDSEETAGLKEHKHQLEVKRNRSQVGAFGRYDLKTGVDYDWLRLTALDVPLIELPAVDLATVRDIRQAADDYFQEAGLVLPEPRQGAGGRSQDRETRVERDLTLDMRVEVAGRGRTTIKELVEAADEVGRRMSPLRCCMDFVRDDADSPRTGTIYQLPHGEIVIHDHVTNITHMLKDDDRKAAMREAFAAALARLQGA